MEENRYVVFLVCVYLQVCDSREKTKYFFHFENRLHLKELSETWFK